MVVLQGVINNEDYIMSKVVYHSIGVETDANQFD
jgi:hypothetical protein